jgi:uncharacterized membrane protein
MATQIPMSQAGTSRGLGRRGARGQNMCATERWASAIAGGALMALGLRRPSWAGALLTLGGGGLLHRAASGRCMVYEAAGIDTSHERRGVASVAHGRGVKIQKSVTINRPPEELYRFWRNFRNLPNFMEHLESVEMLDDRRSRWVAKAPAGTRVEWVAEVYNEREPELIAWRSLPDSDVNHAGSVRFRQGPAGRGTEVIVELSYEPPAGRLGKALAKLFGEEPEQQVEDDLYRFKQLMEAGEIPTTFGQPAARPTERPTARL